MKYKIGDEVIVIEVEYDGWFDDPKKFIGKLFTITRIDEGKTYPYQLGPDVSYMFGEFEIRLATKLDKALK